VSWLIAFLIACSFVFAFVVTFAVAFPVAEFIRRGRGPWREDFDRSLVNRYRDALPTLRESALACGCCGDRGTDGGCPVCGVTS